MEATEKTLAGAQVGGGNRGITHCLTLRAGSLTAVFDPALGGLREIRAGKNEVLRGIYGAVRDQFWGTIKPVVIDLQADPHPDSFRLRFLVHCQAGGIDYQWRADIAGDSRGKIVVVFDGEARSTFLSNRIGLCVLHPLAECAGKPAMIERADGSQAQVLFPFLVEPNQPMRDLRAITHEIESGLWAEVRFQGGVFEMEDQRNWADASFKTYSPPLAEPFPFPVKTGMRLQQRVVLSLLGAQPAGVQIGDQPRPELYLLHQGRQPKAALGLSCASHGQALTACELERLRPLCLSHLRLDIDFQRPGWQELLKQASGEARTLNLGLQLAIFCAPSAKPALQELIQVASQAYSPVTLWMILPETGSATSLALAQFAGEVLGPSSPEIPLAAGTDLDFAALNRNREAVRGGRFVPCFSMNPQVHCSDDRTLVENLDSLKYILDTLRQFAPLPAAVSPITLRPRFNPELGCHPENLAIESTPARMDPRQESLWGAAWTMGTLSRLLTCANIHSLTYYETTGPLGIMNQELALPQSKQFQGPPGSVFPMYHVFADLADCYQVIPLQSNHARLIDGIGLVTRENNLRILAANLSAQPQTLDLRIEASAARIRFMDEINLDLCRQNPAKFRQQTGSRLRMDGPVLSLKLLPNALVRIDLE
jgi:D-apionolactonase